MVVLSSLSGIIHSHRRILQRPSEQIDASFFPLWLHNPVQFKADYWTSP